MNLSNFSQYDSTTHLHHVADDKGQHGERVSEDVEERESHKYTLGGQLLIRVILIGQSVRHECCQGDLDTGKQVNRADMTTAVVKRKKGSMEREVRMGKRKKRGREGEREGGRGGKGGEGREGEGGRGRERGGVREREGGREGEGGGRGRGEGGGEGGREGREGGNREGGGEKGGEVGRTRKGAQVQVKAEPALR